MPVGAHSFIVTPIYKNGGRLTPGPAKIVAIRSRRQIIDIIIKNHSCIYIDCNASMHEDIYVQMYTR